MLREAHSSLTKCECFFLNHYFPSHHLVISQQGWLLGECVTWDVLEIHHFLSQDNDHKVSELQKICEKIMWCSISDLTNTPPGIIKSLNSETGQTVERHKIYNAGIIYNIFCWGKQTAAQMFCCFSPHAALFHFHFSQVTPNITSLIFHYKAIVSELICN